eukprot:scaffold3050_cov362-Prasinococcus_capsulatus_cf.AAC.7
MDGPTYFTNDCPWSMNYQSKPGVCSGSNVRRISATCWRTVSALDNLSALQFYVRREYPHFSWLTILVRRP